MQSMHIFVQVLVYMLHQTLVQTYLLTKFTQTYLLKKSRDDMGMEMIWNWDGLRYVMRVGDYGAPGIGPGLVSYAGLGIGPGAGSCGGLSIGGGVGL